jgi:hypothetical protein
MMIIYDPSKTRRVDDTKTKSYADEKGNEKPNGICLAFESNQTRALPVAHERKARQMRKKTAQADKTQF